MREVTCGKIIECRIQVAGSGICIYRSVKRSVVADVQPLRRIERDARTQIVLVMDVRILPEHTLVPAVIAGQEVFDILCTATERDVMTLGRLYIVVEITPPVRITIKLVRLISLALVNYKPRSVTADASVLRVRHLLPTGKPEVMSLCRSPTFSPSHTPVSSRYRTTHRICMNYGYAAMTRWKIPKDLGL